MTGGALWGRSVGRKYSTERVILPLKIYIYMNYPFFCLMTLRYLLILPSAHNRVYGWEGGVRDSLGLGGSAV